MLMCIYIMKKGGIFNIRTKSLCLLLQAVGLHGRFKQGNDMI